MFLLKLKSQYQYCANFLISGIKDNCKAFQKTLDLLGKIKIDEDVNKRNDSEISDNTNISIEDLYLE
ncbi:17350_t:CDS:1, partial [Funneliformis geosporum]